MEKKKALFLGLTALCVALLLGAVLFALGGNDGPLCKVSFQKEITVANGAASPAAFAEKIHIPKDGRYQLNMEWTSAPGLLTGARLVAADGTVPFAVTGEYLSMESSSLRLQAGDYTLEFVPLANEAAFEAFFAANIAPLQTDTAGEVLIYDEYGQPSTIHAYTFVSDGVWNNAYVYELEASRAFAAGKALGVAVGLVVGFILAAVLLILAKKGNGFRSKFDERQERARGRGYRLGFWTAFGYFAAMIVCGILEIRLPAEPSVIAFLGMIVSAFAFAAYCIWTDAYFALNENRRTLCVIMLAVGALNIGIGIMNVLSGEAVVDGILTYRSINLLCGVLLAALGVVLLARKIKADGEDEEA